MPAVRARSAIWAVAGPVSGYLTVRVGERTNGAVGGVAGRAHTDGCGHGEAEAVALFFALATPESVLVSIAGEHSTD